jgi:cysteinyl-tRNA synthetase
MLASWRDLLNEHKSYWPNYEAEFDDAGMNLVVDALGDDLNTPQMIAELHKLVKHSTSDNGIHIGEAVILRSSLELLGLGPYLDRTLRSELTKETAALLQKRKEAREHGNYGLSDALRDDLKQLGLHVRDHKYGTAWWWS